MNVVIVDHELSDAAYAGSIVASFVALIAVFGWLLRTIWHSSEDRHKRAENEFSEVRKEIGDTQEDVAHIEGHLEAKTGYRPRSK